MKHSRRPYRKDNPRNTKSSIDGRKYRSGGKSVLIRLAIDLCENQGMHPEQVAQRLGVSVRSVYRWKAHFRKHGRGAFPISKRNKSHSLSEEQLQEIVKIVVNSTPFEHGLQTVLWTRAIIGQIIYNKFNKKLHETTIGRILKRVGITAQKPIRKAYQQNKDDVKLFCEVLFPELAEKVKKEGAVIAWLDESTIKSDPNNGRTWGEKGETPEVPSNGSPKKINVIGTVDQNGNTLFMTYEGTTDSEVVMKFIDMLSKSTNRKIYLILDNAKYHTSIALKEHVEKYHKGWLELIYLPPYSPELNPCELMWAHLKSHGINRLLTKNKLEFIDAVENHLCKLCGDKELCKSFLRKSDLSFINKAFKTAGMSNLVA